MPAIWPYSPSRENDIMMMSCSLQIFIPASAVSSVYFEKLPIYPAEKNLNFKKKPSIRKLQHWQDQISMKC